MFKSNLLMKPRPQVQILGNQSECSFSILFPSLFQYFTVYKSLIQAPQEQAWPLPSRSLSSIDNMRCSEIMTMQGRMCSALLRTCRWSLWYWCKDTFAGKIGRRAGFAQCFKEWKGEQEEQTQELRDTLFIHLFHMSSGMLGKKI